MFLFSLFRRDPLFRELVSAANLAAAWHEVRAAMSPAQRLRPRVQRFEDDWPYEMAEIATMLRRGQYPAPARITFELPKSSGGVRELTSLDLRERIVQRALLHVLTPIVERRSPDCSFGFRPGRGVLDAVARLQQYRSAGCNWAFKGDIDSCFDSLDHSVLRRQVARLVPSRGIRRLLFGFLRASGRRRLLRRVGVPQGAAVSPLLANIYMEAIDRECIRRRLQLIRYADDFLIACCTESEARRAGREVSGILRRLRLKVKREKAGVARLSAGYEFLGTRIGLPVAAGQGAVAEFAGTGQWLLITRRRNAGAVGRALMRRR